MSDGHLWPYKCESHMGPQITLEQLESRSLLPTSLNVQSLARIPSKNVKGIRETQITLERSANFGQYTYSKNITYENHI